MEAWFHVSVIETAFSWVSTQSYLQQQEKKNRNKNKQDLCVRRFPCLVFFEMQWYRDTEMYVLVML